MIKLVLLLLLIATSGCTLGRSADRQVQICLESEEGVATFRRILVAVSKRNALEFFDDSERVARDLRSLKSDLVGRYPIRHYHAHDKDDGIEISASNLGLGRYETTLSYDLRSARQRRVADDLTASLESEFKIVPTPGNRGASPLQDCPTGSTKSVRAKRNEP